MGLGSFIKKTVGGAVSSLGGLGGVASIATDVLGAVLNANAQEEANEMNYKIHRENLEWNKPINQMRRFQEAGLNPNLIYTQGNAGNATAQPVMKPVEYKLSPSQSIANALGLQNMKEQNANLQAQNNLINSQSAAAAENARRTRLENEFFEKHGYWPGQEAGFMRALRGGVGVLPGLYFDVVDKFYDMFLASPEELARKNKVNWNPKGG